MAEANTTARRTQLRERVQEPPERSRSSGDRGGRRERPARWSRSRVALAAGLGTTMSPIFRLKNVRVTGTSHLSAGQVIEAAGLAKGANVFWLDTGEVQRRVESLNWVESAQVSKTLPGTIAIAIHER